MQERLVDDALDENGLLKHVRRLAAATGTPSSINDDAIDLPLPSETPGLPPASAICANIKIARVTGQIITSESSLSNSAGLPNF